MAMLPADEVAPDVAVEIVIAPDPEVLVDPVPPACVAIVIAPYFLEPELTAEL